jgi:hypothetical protein
MQTAFLALISKNQASERKVERFKQIKRKANNRLPFKNNDTTLILTKFRRRKNYQ